MTTKEGLICPKHLNPCSALRIWKLGVPMNFQTSTIDDVKWNPKKISEYS